MKWSSPKKMADPRDADADSEGEEMNHVVLKLLALAVLAGVAVAAAAMG